MSWGDEISNCALEACGDPATCRNGDVISDAVNTPRFCGDVIGDPDRVRILVTVEASRVLRSRRGEGVARIFGDASDGGGTEVET